jgi:hypothetical protein
MNISVQESAASYRKTTLTFLDFARGLSHSDLDKKNDKDPWTPRMVIHHVADSETNSYIRLRRLLAEPGTLIQGYEESAWASTSALGYIELPVEGALAVIAAVREASASILERVSEAEMLNECVHSESGKYLISDWIKTYQQHPLDHLAQIKSILSS